MTQDFTDLADQAASPQQILAGLENAPLDELLAAARARSMAHFGPRVTYSPKVFIPLTRLCRDVCHYCTFATTPGRVECPYLSLEDVLEIARAGARQGCREALFTLGDRPEDRYGVAREWLADNGYESTLEYLADASRVVFEETGLLPHLNPGIMNAADYAALRPFAASMGLMLESASARLCEKGGPHYGSPDKVPEVRLASIAAAGEARVPFTSGLLIGISETRLERIEALCALRDLHLQYGHIQEVIIQNYRAKPDTRMASHPDATLEEQVWTLAAARLVLPADMAVQAPPNLRPVALDALLSAGLNDWGGVSPVTPDHVNPEAPWPQVEALRKACEARGLALHERLAIGPRHARNPEMWVDRNLAKTVRRQVDGRGVVRGDDWFAGSGRPVPTIATKGASSPHIATIVRRLSRGEAPVAHDLKQLFAAEGEDFAAVTSLADRLRREAVGDVVTHVINRNINYTNICLYKCGFCAFSKGSTRKMRGPAYRLDLEEVGRRAAEAAARGATEVCLQGGIHPDYDGHTYLAILEAVRRAAPDIHIHAFSALEVSHGAQTLGLGLREYLVMLKNAGLGTLPGTAAEILDPEVRCIIAPDKITGAQWLEVMRTAHEVDLPTTATIMFGHIDGYEHWASHLMAIRELQERTRGFTEFVPLPFVHMEAPIWMKGDARSGPTYREAVLMHAIARIALNGLVPNIQVSWVKMGADGAAACLEAGANDLGGVLMEESITRAAGGVHGQLFDRADMARVAASVSRPLRERTTKYTPVPDRRADAASSRKELERI